MRQLGRQIVYQLKVFGRSPVAVFFTVVLPLVMMLLFNALFGDERVQTAGGSYPLRQFYVGGLAAFTAVSATFTNLANTVPQRREEGILKRWRATPLPPWMYVGGMIGSAIVIAAVGVLIMLGVGIVAYDVELQVDKIPMMVAMFVLAVGTFAALGIAVAALIPSVEAAPAVANAIILPLGFISDVFIQMQDAPSWLTAVADFFPLRPFAQSFQDGFNPFIDGSGWVWDRALRVALWGVVGILVAVRWFRWEPSRRAGSPARRRSRSRRRGPAAA
ncbi:MAG: ABC transporter permease [Desertimonas sp.]